MKEIKILVTRGAGFIGSEFVRMAAKKPYKLVVIDKLTYAGDMDRLKKLNSGFEFYKADICNKKIVCDIFKNHNPEIVVHFAAETHVDRSILGSTPFIRTNIVGTQNLLDASRECNIKRLFIFQQMKYMEILKADNFMSIHPLIPVLHTRQLKNQQIYLLNHMFELLIFPP